MKRSQGIAWLGLVLSTGVGTAPAVGQEARRPARDPDEMAVRRLLQRADELLAAREYDRAIRMLETVIKQNPDSPVRYEAHLALGRHYLEQHSHRKAIYQLGNLNDLRRPDARLSGPARDLYLEGLLLSGIAHYRLKEYPRTFLTLRKITSGFPDTAWANDAYYYIGMAHFSLGNWEEAIANLSLVGTFIDPDSPAVQYVEAGQRFYVKAHDADLPVLARLGRPVTVSVSTRSGDAETLTCLPLSEEKGLFIASVPSAVGPAAKGDHVLQVLGGDVITTRYTDANDRAGTKNVVREATVTVVSTGTLSFTTGTFADGVDAAFLGQPLFALLRDVDLDTGEAADGVEVRIVSRYHDEAAANAPLDGDLPAEAADGPVYQVRDEVRLRLTELGSPPVRSGRFGGSVRLAPAVQGDDIDRTDDVLSCDLGDEVVVTYVDERHIGGRTPRQVSATIRVAGDVDVRPRATQNIVPDDVLRSKKLLVEATAYLELARIFRSMGLTQGAAEKAAAGLERSQAVIGLRGALPEALREEGFKLTWELYLVQDDFRRAIATCRAFNRLYPDSPFVDEALLGIARAKFERKDYRGAAGVFRNILSLPKSRARAEAQFMIARCAEAEHPDRPERYAPEYKRCAQRYPDSPFAGESIAKLVDYYMSEGDHARAEELLEQVFQDYPDAEFLDRMLLKWIVAAYAREDYATAYDKCNQLLMKYPGSPYAAKAKRVYDRIQSQVKGTP